MQNGRKVQNSPTILLLSQLLYNVNLMTLPFLGRLFCKIIVLLRNPEKCHCSNTSRITIFQRIIYLLPDFICLIIIYYSIIMSFVYIVLVCIYLLNECFDALSIAVAAMPLIQQNGNVAVLLAALFVQLRVLTVKGQVASLRPLVNSIETTISQTDYTLHKKCLETLRTWCALYDGDWNISDRWLKQQEHNTSQSLHFMNILTQFVQIRIYLQTERFYLAISLAEQLIPLLEYWHREKDLCEARLLYALALFAIVQNTRAYQLLDVTLPIIKRRRFDRLAADEGEQMYLLLRSYRKTHGLEDAYLDRIITLSKEMGLLYPDYLRRRCEKFTPLTQTELHVLTLIADGRSNVQIADYLDISVNTVKFHCKNIFQKLDATNRQQAIKTAQELKLLRK